MGVATKRAFDRGAASILREVAQALDSTSTPGIDDSTSASIVLELLEHARDSARQSDPMGFALLLQIWRANRVHMQHLGMQEAMKDAIRHVHDNTDARGRVSVDAVVSYMESQAAVWEQRAMGAEAPRRNS